ncbi:MAG: hypothetical protein A4E47_00173 [Methanosaeta sp. PtaU1.Bin028]|nr:MAG: hypothetical protein A4E47_00173 [Methanosaeta sp. PtaU1.Bin028]
MRALSLQKSPAFPLSAAVALGLAYPAAGWEWLIIPSLLLAMTFSLQDVRLERASGLKKAAAGLMLNYLLLSGVIIALSQGLDDPALRQGYLVMAAVPPAIAVVPLSRLLGGDVSLAVLTESICYLAGLVLTPMIIFAFAHVSGAGMLQVGQAVLLLIVLPFFISRKVHLLGLNPDLPVTLGLFLVTYLVVGANQDALWEVQMLDAGLIAVARTFLTGAVAFLILGALGSDRETRITLTLFGSYKNLGLTAAMALLIFGQRAAIPAAVCALAETAFYITLALLSRWRCEPERTAE